MDNNIIELPSPMGGVMWKGHLSGLDDTGDSLRINDGYSTMKAFIEEHEHVGWTLSIFDTITEYTIEIDCCDLAEMPKIVSLVYNLEKAAPIAFIGENPMSESYVVGMPCTRGRLNIPGIYRVENGKLIDAENEDPEVGRQMRELRKELSEETQQKLKKLMNKSRKK